MWLVVHLSTLKCYLPVWGFVIDQKFCFLMQYFWSFYVIFEHCIISPGISYLLLPAQHLIPGDIFQIDFSIIMISIHPLSHMCMTPMSQVGVHSPHCPCLSHHLENQRHFMKAGFLLCIRNQRKILSLSSHFILFLHNTVSN